MFQQLLFPLIAAIIPTIIYIYLIWWCDRYEREPGWLLLIAFGWGAIPAILLSIVAELALQEPFELFAQGISGSMAQLFLISPVVEELAKGLALAGLFLFFRSEIDGVLDGIVYGALVGAGFAMSENFFYFIATDALDEWLTLALVRSIVFGLNHSFYTAITGAAFGYVALRKKGWQTWFVPVGGLVLAIFVHMLHNVTTYLASDYPAMMVLSLLLSWGGIFTLIAIIGLAQKQENYWIRAHLADEVPYTLSQEHYILVQERAQRFGRVQAMLRGKSRSRAWLETDMHRKATELAFRKHRLMRLEEEADPNLSPEIIRLRSEVAELDKRLLFDSSV